MTINLTQIRSDFDNGIIVSKQTLLALVDYAIELESKEPIAWHCVNEVTGKMLYTDSESQMIEMRDAKAGHWKITKLAALKG